MENSDVSSTGMTSHLKVVQVAGSCCMYILDLKAFSQQVMLLPQLSYKNYWMK